MQASVGSDPDSFFSEIIVTGDHFKVIEEVYNGQCIAGTAFYDARQDVDLPGVEDRVIILSITTTVPQLNISFSKSINPELSQKLMNYFLNSSESENLILLSGLSDASETIKLIEINDYYYNEIRDLFRRAGEDPENYLDE
jgi:ABC-type phosphate/phosphonate transport system substrate-binding protein